MKKVLRAVAAGAILFGGVAAAGATSASASDDIGRCHTSMVKASIKYGDPAAGNRYAKLILTNVSGESCQIYGYGGFQLLKSDYQYRETHVVRDPSVGPRLITLKPGQHASSTIHWGVIPTGDETNCAPNASYLMVTPPDETATITIPWKGGTVCNSGTFDQRAYRWGITQF